MLIRFFVVLLPLCYSCLSFANLHMLDRLNNQALWYGSLMHVDYKEYALGRFLDGVSGFTPGMGLRISKTYQHFMIEPSLSYHQQQLSYDGFQQPVHIPLRADSDNCFLQADLKLGYTFLFSDCTEFVPYIHYGFSRWDREVPPIGSLVLGHTLTNVQVNGYKETYRYQFWQIGVKWQHQLSSCWAMMLGASFGRTVAPRMDSYIPDTQTMFRTVSIDAELGTDNIYHAVAGVDYL